jgi:hypothetical protein
VCHSIVRQSGKKIHHKDGRHHGQESHVTEFLMKGLVQLVKMLLPVAVELLRRFLGISPPSGGSS